jgi:hypothetical protein
VLPRGELYESRLDQFDIRFTKVFQFGKAKVRGSFDVYNLMNNSTILQAVTSLGPAWRNPSQFLSPRLFKVGGQIDF